MAGQVPTGCWRQSGPVYESGAVRMTIMQQPRSLNRAVAV
jgi:hypothetical protein